MATSDILIVDDNVGNIDVLRSFLRDEGHRIIVATSGEQALKTISRYIPDIILLDVMMPGIDGFETCRRLKADALTQHIPVLFLTARDDPESLLEGFSAGGADYIVKPFHQEEVLARMNTHLHNRLLINQLQQAQQELEGKVAARTHELVLLNDKLINEKDVAEEATRIKDKFVSLVAHDLRAPLHGMKGYLECLMDDIEHASLDDFKVIFEKIMKCVDNQSSMINGILNISRFQTGKITLRPKFLDAYFLASAAVDKITFAAEQKGVLINNKIDKGYRVFADDYLFGEVLSNLLSNAVKFSKAGCEIILTLTLDDQHITFAVQDNGRGIDQNFLVNLFKLEEKTSMAGTAGEKGTGLGLPYSQDIVKAHGGEIRVESEPGVGSTFYVSVPIVKPRVLLVDDDPVCHKMLANCLQPFQVDTDIANNGYQALEHIAERDYHLVISDIRMPEMDGFELLSQLKKQVNTEEVPVILITAHDDLSARQKCFDMGGDDYVTKPIADHEFMPRIRRFIGACHAMG